MHDVLPILRNTDFPPLLRKKPEILQVNIGLRCNQQCVHCHVNASPRRTEAMNNGTVDSVLDFLRTTGLSTLDITGGAPELHPQFRYLVRNARKLGIHVIDRCNLTILLEPGQEGLAHFLAEQGVEIIASLPCYQLDNVDRQRGKGVFEKSIRALQELNRLGYGMEDNGLALNLVYNPQGPTLPPDQEELEQAYKRELKHEFGIVFNQLFTLCNMPINRFGSMLVSKGEFHSYLQLLKSAHQDRNLDDVMCRNLISVDWRGRVYDCDFNQMLGLYMKGKDDRPLYLSDLANMQLENREITVCDHCYGCSAGQGSSCSGALNV